EAGVEMADEDLVDIRGRDAGIGQRRCRRAHDQRFDVLALEPAERRMAPADDAGGHDGSSCSGESLTIANPPTPPPRPARNAAAPAALPRPHLTQASR